MFGVFSKAVCILFQSQLLRMKQTQVSGSYEQDKMEADFFIFGEYIKRKFFLFVKKKLRKIYVLELLLWKVFQGTHRLKQEICLFLNKHNAQQQFCVNINRLVLHGKDGSLLFVTLFAELIMKIILQPFHIFVE